jgi:hypothetical protein
LENNVITLVFNEPTKALKMGKVIKETNRLVYMLVNGKYFVYVKNKENINKIVYAKKR